MKTASVSWVSWIAFRMTGVVLLTICSLKIAAISVEKPYLDTTSVFGHGIKYRHVIMLSAAIELLAGAMLLASRNYRRVAFLSALLGAMFFAYHVTLLLMNYHDPCGCLGSLTDLTSLSKAFHDAFIYMVISVLIVNGNYALWIVPNQSKNCCNGSNTKSF